MRIGLLGGTFDPVHIGHLKLAEAALRGANLDQVWFMPVNTPPHKEPAHATTSERLEMLLLAVEELNAEQDNEEDQRYLVKDWELVKGGHSFTINTVRELMAENPDDEFYWIIGSDLLPGLMTWKNIDDLIELIYFIVLNRPTHPVDDSFLPDEVKKKLIHIEMLDVDISSTEVRDKTRLGDSVEGLIPEAVADYIQKSGLYE